MSARELGDVARAFKALGDPTRLAIFEFIRCCGANVEMEGDSLDDCQVAQTCVGDICCRFEVAASTVSHHLKELRAAGLIHLEKRGRWVFVTADEQVLGELAGFLRQTTQTARVETVR
ncbi:MAG: helix-turn-helix transcriptional regulator [Armatimonadetes bacterium]|nr:helix-turn-helix transcriptional regulator [Armatimonadota bacterium]